MVNTADLTPTGELSNTIVGPRTGRRDLKIWGGNVLEDYQRELRGTQAVKIYDEMRRSEPVVSGMLAAITTIVQGITWEVHPGPAGSTRDSKDPVDLAAAEHVGKAWNEICSQTRL